MKKAINDLLQLGAVLLLAAEVVLLLAAWSAGAL